MRSTPVSLSLAAAAVALIGAAAAPSAQAEGVAYLDGREVWVASLDGTQKVRLSGGEGNWESVAQSTDGYVVATRREDPAKVTQTGTFTIWRPDGTVKDAGPLAGKTAADAREVLPLGIALPPGGGVVILGYASYIGGADLGYFVMPSGARTRPIGGWASVGAVHAPTLVGDRVVGTPDGHAISIQNPGGGPASPAFTPWAGVNVSGAEVDFVEVAESGRTLALGTDFGSGAPAGLRSRIIVWPVPGLGQAPVALPGAAIPGGTGDCFLPTSGDATTSSFSLDGRRLAWSDSGGVRIAGTPLVQPTVPPDNLCALSAPAITIAPTGKDPSIGGIDVAAILAARNPTPLVPVGGTGGTGDAGNPGAPRVPAVPGGGGTAGPTGGGGIAGGPGAVGAPGGTTTTPSVTFVKLTSLKIASLGSKSGASVQAVPTVGGKATFTLTVEPRSIGAKGKTPVTIATGKATLAKGKASTVKLKANAAGRKAAKKLKKKQATLTVKVGGTTSTTTVGLR